MAMLNQKERIIKYLQMFGSITSAEAFSSLGITKLATRISEMRHEDGLEFNIESVTGKNRFGQATRYARYSLKEDNNA